MDIFTTQLTRVVPVPIKPASLKVKALLKDAANTKLSQDPDHLENHEYYFTNEEDQYHGSQQEAKQDNKKAQQETVIDDSESKDAEASALETAQQSVQKAAESEKSDAQTVQKNNKPKHLDLYA